MENKAKQERYLTELRPFIMSEDYTSAHFVRRLDTLMSFVGNLYRYHIGKYRIPFTSVIHVMPVNASNGVRIAELGEARMPFGRVSCFLDEEKISKLEIDSIREYVAQEIHNAMRFFAQKFNLPILPLDKAYEELNRSRFIASDNKVKHSPNRKYRFNLCIRSNWETVDFWLQIQNKTDKQTRFFFIDNIPNFYAIEHPELSGLHVTDYMYTYIRYINVVGWKSNTLIELISGDKNLLFDLDKETIIEIST